MLVESVFMELRARLRSCNVYITTGVDLKKDCNLRISLQSDGIVLNYVNSYICNGRKDSCSSIESLSDCYSEDDSDVTMVIKIEDFCKIIPNSMSGLKIDRNNISFRILTEPKDDAGNFYTEILSPRTESCNIEAAKLKVNVKANEKLKIVCANCSNVISDGLIKFDRVLELPTEHLDMSEWFCHDHGPKTEKIAPLDQKKYDFLYRLTYFVVNLTEMSEKSNKFNKKRDIYHCNRCLAWLGMKDVKGTVKLFNSTAKIDHEGTEMFIFAHKNLSLNTNVNDFIYTIECMTREFNLGFQYTVMCKLVLECSFGSKKQYILVWIMDKQLQVLHSGNNETQNGDTVGLKSTFLTKILYKTDLCLNEEVETWLADPGVVSTEISQSMFQGGSEHLKNMSMKIPASFRSTNGFTVSFLNA